MYRRCFAPAIRSIQSSSVRSIFIAAFDLRRGLRPSTDSNACAISVSTSSYAASFGAFTDASADNLAADVLRLAASMIFHAWSKFSEIVSSYE